MRKNRYIIKLGFFCMTGLLYLNTGLSQNPASIRLGFCTDIHFNAAPGTNDEFGGVKYRKGESDYVIPVKARDAFVAVKPDYIFDCGDLTEGRTPGNDSYKYYKQWMDALGAPVYPILGNHDRICDNPGDTYGTGLFSEMGQLSSTKILKMGNMIFILISDEHTNLYSQTDIPHTDKKFAWVKDQIAKYASGDYNIFILEHYPVPNTTAWSDGYWYGTNAPIRAYAETEWKNMLTTYQNSVVAHVSGHLHCNFAWEDTPDDITFYNGYGDGNKGVEDVGMFLNGSDYANLPNIYFLNIQALDHRHGAAKNYLSTTAIYYADMENGATQFQLITRDIYENKDVDSYIVSTRYPIDIGSGKMEFKASDLCIRARDIKDIVDCTDKDWFKIFQGKTTTITFQQRWKNKINVTGIEVISNNGSYHNVRYKGSSDTGSSWSNWSITPPYGIDVLQVEITFTAGSMYDMVVKDIKVLRVEDSTSVNTN